MSITGNINIMLFNTRASYFSQSYTAVDIKVFFTSDLVSLVQIYYIKSADFGRAGSFAQPILSS